MATIIEEFAHSGGHFANDQRLARITLALLAVAATIFAILIVLAVRPS